MTCRFCSKVHSAGREIRCYPTRASGVILVALTMSAKALLDGLACVPVVIIYAGPDLLIEATVMVLQRHGWRVTAVILMIS